MGEHRLNPSAAAVRWFLTLLPALIGVPALFGALLSAADLLQVAYPDLGWATTVLNDGKAVWLGDALYADPSSGYSGMLYTPLFPIAVAGLLGVHPWDGWPLLLSMASALGLAALVGGVGFARPPRKSSFYPWAMAVIGAVGLAGLSWWMVAGLPLSLLFEGRADHFAWLFAFTGVLVLVRGSKSSLRSLCAGAVLLSLAVWSKQSTLPLAFVAFGAVATLAFLERSGRLRVMAVLAAVLALNGLLFAAITVGTDGWAPEFLVGLPGRHARFSSVSESLAEAARGLAFPLLMAIALWAWVIFRTASGRRVGLRASLASADYRARATLVLWLFVGIGGLAALYFRGKQGAAANQFIGVAWALGFLVALGWRRAVLAPKTRASRLLAPVGLLLLGVLLAWIPGFRSWTMDRGWGSPEPGVRVVAWKSLPDEVVVLGRTRLVYDPVNSGLSAPRGQLYPNYFNFADLLAAGLQPGYLRDALLDRRFDVVRRFDASEANDIYTSAAGAHQRNYLWKLNRVIEAGYQSSPSVPVGFLVRRHGVDAVSRYRACWGPFASQTAAWEIAGGGGFWCRRGGRVILEETPALDSELRLQGPVVASGGGLNLAVGAERGDVRVVVRGIECAGAAYSGRVPRQGGGPVLDWSITYDQAPATESTSIVPTLLRIGWYSAGDDLVVPSHVVRAPLVRDCRYSVAVVATAKSSAWVGIGGSGGSRTDGVGG